MTATADPPAELDDDTRRVLRRLAEWRSEEELTPALARETLARLGEFAPPRVPAVRAEEAAVAGPAGALPLRIFHPPDADPRAVLHYVHGGGWVTGHLGLVDGLAEQLAAASGLTVVASDYRLAPEHPFPAALEDVAAAYAWVREELLAQRPHARVALLGESAGGNLVAALTLRLRDAGAPGPNLQVLVYPALDPTQAGASHVRYGVGYGLDAEAMAWYWRQYLGEQAARVADPLAAPLCAASLAGLPPAIVLTAGCDPLRDDGAEYARRLQRDGVRALELRYPQAIHGFFSASGGIARGLDAIRDLGALMRAELLAPAHLRQH